MADCKTGKRYPDELSANIAIANQQLKANRHRKHGKKGVEIPIRSYPCPFCKGWHTTSQPKRNQNNGIDA